MKMNNTAAFSYLSAWPPRHLLGNCGTLFGREFLSRWRFKMVVCACLCIVQRSVAAKTGTSLQGHTFFICWITKFFDQRVCGGGWKKNKNKKAILHPRGGIHLCLRSLVFVTGARLDVAWFHWPPRDHGDAAFGARMRRSRESPNISGKNQQK